MTEREPAMATEEQLDLKDADAMERHGTLDAAAGYALLAEKTWSAFRAFDVERGRMLAFGDHAHTFTGVPDPDTTDGYQEWIAAIPQSDGDGRTAWPHVGLRTREHTDLEPAVHDVVITSLPFADVHFRSEYSKARLLQLHQRYPIHAIAHTLPGGILATVASHRVLDDPDPAVRELLMNNADLLGAARLPATALRTALSDDEASSTDLLLFRRRIPGDPINTVPFIDVEPVAVPGGVAVLNEYFAMSYPEHVAGTTGVVADPDHPDGVRYTVRGSDQPLDVVLHHVLSRIVRQARAENLTAVSASWAPPESRLAPEAERLARRSSKPRTAPEL
ncbi:hypothetical protein [Promicromonospora soli]